MSDDLKSPPVQKLYGKTGQEILCGKTTQASGNTLIMLQAGNRTVRNGALVWHPEKVRHRERAIKKCRSKRNFWKTTEHGTK